MLRQRKREVAQNTFSRYLQSPEEGNEETEQQQSETADITLGNF